MKKCRLLIGLILTLLAFAPVLACGGGGPSGAKPIRFGILGPMAYEQGFRMMQAADIAKDEIMKDGGIRVGNEVRPVEFVKIDTNEFVSVPDSVLAAERAVSVEKCDFMIGGARSEAAIAMQDVFADNNKIFVVITAGDMTLSKRVGENYDRYKGFFRVFVNSTQTAQLLFIGTQAILTQIKQALNVDKLRVAIVMPKTAFYDPIATAGEANLPKYGCEVVGTWRPSALATDVTAEVTAIKAKNAHVVWWASNEQMNYSFVRAISDLNVPVMLFGVNGIGQTKKWWSEFFLAVGYNLFLG